MSRKKIAKKVFRTFCLGGMGEGLKTFGCRLKLSIIFLEKVAAVC